MMARGSPNDRFSLQVPRQIAGGQRDHDRVVAASTRSMRMMASSADHQAGERNSMKKTPVAFDTTRTGTVKGALVIAGNHK